MSEDSSSKKSLQEERRPTALERSARLEKQRNVDQ
jgi:hypothetical protein